MKWEGRNQQVSSKESSLERQRRKPDGSTGDAQLSMAEGRLLQGYEVEKGKLSSARLDGRADWHMLQAK